MEQWSAPESNTQLTACYASLGFPIRVEKQLDSSSGHRACVFFIGEATAPGFPANRLSTVQKDYREGTMELQTPMHPLLVAMRAMHNLNRLIDWIKKGEQQRLKYINGRQSTIYESGTAHAPEAVMIQTGDIDAVAALGVIGVPVCGIDGYGNAHRFSVPALGMDIMGPLGEYAIDAAELLKELRAGNLKDFDSDFMAAYNALKARRELMGAIYAAKSSVLIRKPNSLKRAYVLEGASGNAMDKVKKHFHLA
jgi:hypothetical protein